MSAVISPYAGQYQALITSEHNQQSNFMQLVGLHAGAAADVTAALALMPGNFNLATAIGAQLDQIGQWIGQSRYIPFVLIPDFFGFAEAGSPPVPDPGPQLPWGEFTNPSIGGVWYGFGETFSGTDVLNDAQYRVVLAARIIRNQSNGRLADLEAGLQLIFGVPCAVIDNGTLSLTINVTQPISALDRALVTSMDILPRPAGVAIGNITYVNTSVNVPNVVGLTQAAATATITSAGLILGTVNTASSGTVPAGDIISESPAAGTSVAPGSAVNIVTSTGVITPPNVNVPNVVGLTQAAATSAITTATLVLGTVTNASSSTVPSGDVISENPAAGASVAPGTAVNIVVSTGGSGGGKIYKFFAGDGAVSIQAQHNMLGSQWIADIAALVSHPIPGPIPSVNTNQLSNQLYIAGWDWPTLESGNGGRTSAQLVTDAQTGTNQFAGFSNILTVYTALLASIPNANFGFTMQAVKTGNKYTAATITSRDWATTGKVVPSDIALPPVAGQLTVPMGLGNASQVFPIAPMFSGSSYYGIGFSAYQITQSSPLISYLENGVPAWWNPGVNQRWINFWQALSLFTYAAPPGHPLHGTPAGAALTFDTDPNFVYIFSNDEYSYAFLNGYNPHDSNGLTVTVNPPAHLGGTANDTPSNTNFFANYKAWATAATGFFPHTLVGTCFSYGFGGSTSDTPANMAAYTNQNIGAGALSTIVGLALSDSDIYGADWSTATPTSGQANFAKQGFVGIKNPPAPTGLGTYPGVQSLTGYMPYVAQIQPSDYQYGLGSGVLQNKAVSVVAIAAACNNSYVQANMRLWWMGDGVTFGTTAWTTYVQPQFVAGVTPFSTGRPSNLP
jgi:hypothetical protein